MKYLIRSLIILITITTVAPQAVLCAQAKNKPAKDPALEAIRDLADVDTLSRWMTYYYLRPQPEMIVPALLLADKQGLLAGDTAAPLQAFSSRVFAQNPDKVKDWFTRLGGMSENGKTIVMTAIWWSNSKEGKELLDSIAANLPDKSKTEFHKQIDSTPPAIENMDITAPDVLDMLWACYSATGDTKYVKRLMTTLPWGKSDSKDLPKMLIASAARWSLQSNINQHAKVKEFCESTAREDGDLKPYIEKILADAAAATKKDQDKQATAETSKKGTAKSETAAKPETEK